MNLLVIIGNGFDLAHGLKTSYRDFMMDYLISAIEEVSNVGKYEDDVMKLNKKDNPNFISTSDIIGWIRKDVRALRNLLDNEDYIFKISEIQNLPNNLSITFKNSFIKCLFKSSNEKWVDIEEFYYKQLLELVTKGKVEEEIDTLNAGMRFLRDKLRDYLSKIGMIQIDPLQALRFSRMCLDDYCDETDGKKNIQELTFLNFNYTNYFRHYRQEFELQSEKTNVSYISIHGTINIKNNPIIFGYGDEMDSNYKILEDANDNRLLDFAKSFGYFQTNNYKDLERFVNAEPFDVFIMGHSCGLSDRVMLNMIFEHDNCESIRIFYHDKGDEGDNFTELTQNISRHFKDKGKMRHRIVCKEESKPLMNFKLQ